ncbi:vitamin K epoxide reductase family protein [Candidatus Roizmanbacteria bacterium]|nr:vitamin K epoxide reductase family protein [Candidatus Roizmanbacteria bacterium]
MKNTNTIWKIISFLSLTGIVLASYLLYSYIVRPAFQPCSINQTINCDAVIKGPVSTFFGLPTSLIGLIGYIVIFASSLLKKKRLLLAMSTFGLIFCLRITVIELFVIKVICPVCIACQLIMLVIFFLSLRLVKPKQAK